MFLGIAARDFTTSMSPSTPQLCLVWNLAASLPPGFAGRVSASGSRPIQRMHSASRPRAAVLTRVLPAFLLKRPSVFFFPSLLVSNTTFLCRLAQELAALVFRKCRDYITNRDFVSIVIYGFFKYFLKKTDKLPSFECQHSVLHSP